MEIIYLLAELIPCLIIGYLFGRFRENLSFVVAVPLVNFGIPISLMGLLLKTGLSLHLFEAALMGLATIGLMMLIVRQVPRLRKSIPNQALQLGSGFGNTGYFGIPVSLALLPQQALSYSIGFDLGATLVIWSLGPFLLKRSSNQLQGGEPWQYFFNALISSPASKGLIGALIIQLSPWNKQITSAIWLPSQIVMVLALVIVGMRLGWLKTLSPLTIKSQLASVQQSLMLKLIALPTLMISLCLIFRLPSMMRSALVLQAAAPTAISVLLLAQVSSKNQDNASLLVVCSTLISLITIPLWALILRL